MTDLEVYQPQTAEIATRQIDDWVPVLAHVADLASKIANSPFVPEGLRGSVPATAAAILTGRELGIPPMTALANIHVIKGKTGLSALLMRALIQAQGHEWQDVTVTDTRVVVKGRRRGEAEWTEASFTADQARAAKIDISSYPQDKLYARATVRLARRKFADVIAGMPYSAEELEDGDAGDETPAALPAAETKPRTARRRQAATETASPASPPPRAAETPVTPPPERDAGEAPMPPLPGEDEPDDTTYDTPGTVTGPQITAIWTVLNTAFKFTKDEKDQARAVCAHIIGRELASTKDMSKNEGRTVLDTLASWQDVAEKHEESPRAFLIELMATASGEGEGA
jgi:hypothetical protein